MKVKKKVGYAKSRHGDNFVISYNGLDMVGRGALKLARELERASIKDSPDSPFEEPNSLVAEAYGHMIEIMRSRALPRHCATRLKAATQIVHDLKGLPATRAHPPLMSKPSQYEYKVKFSTGEEFED